MRQHIRQFVLTFVFAVLIDVVGGWHIRTLVGSEMGAAVGSVILAHLLAFAGFVWFIDEPNNWRRLSLTISGALGAGVGTAIVVLWL